MSWLERREVLIPSIIIILAILLTGIAVTYPSIRLQKKFYTVYIKSRACVDENGKLYLDKSFTKTNFRCWKQEGIEASQQVVIPVTDVYLKINFYRSPNELIKSETGYFERIDRGECKEVELIIKNVEEGQYHIWVQLFKSEIGVVRMVDGLDIEFKTEICESHEK